MLLLIFVLCLATIYMTSYGLLAGASSDKSVILRRLNKIGMLKISDGHDELNLPLFNRVIKPMINEFNKTAMGIMPSQIKNKIEKKIIEAGNPLGFSVEKWINLQLSMVVGLPVLTLLISLVGRAQIKKVLIVTVLEVILGIVMPNFMLSKKVTERQNKITNSLPDILDLLTVSVEAGLGFDAALSKVTEKMPGELSDEFKKAIQEIKIGVPRKEALRNIITRTNVSDLTTFVGSIIQADQLGVSIGNVLRIQSAQMRQKRRQRAQEKAMKAPVKMLFPMVFFIFPTIFAVLLGPIVIRLMNTFMK